MANAITEVPENVTGAGYTFNYGMWTAGTTLTLVNVPWDSDYREVARPGFNYDGWINGQSRKLTINQSKHAALDRPIRIATPFEVTAQYNYIRATNPAQPVAGSLPSTYYYFIKKVEYGSANATTLILQLDVWATFINNVTFGRAYIERSHLGVANQNQMVENGRRYLTVPEGFDTGGEMMIAKNYDWSIASARKNSVTDIDFAIMITSTVDLEDESWMNAEKFTLHTAQGSVLENLPNGMSIYIFKDVGNFNFFLEANNRNSHVTQGISSITIIPSPASIGMEVENVENMPGLPGIPPGTVVRPSDGAIKNLTKDLTDDWTADVGIPSRYSGLKKFLVYPYTLIEMTTYTGQPLVLKPESLPNRKLSAACVIHLNPGSQRLSFVPLNYNAQTPGFENDSVGMLRDNGEWLDMATSITNFPQFSTVNNSFAAYMQTNQNQVAFQHDSARWDQTKAFSAADTAVKNANAGIANTDAQAGIQNHLRGQTTSVQHSQRIAQAGADVFSTLGNAGGSLVSGGGVGAAASAAGGLAANAINTTSDLWAMGQNLSNQNAATLASANATNAAAGAVRDNNLSLASLAAQGDYANAINGIEARVQDMKMLQPTTSGQIGGDAFVLAKMGWRLWAKLKRVNSNAMSIIGEYWLRYGYQVHAWTTLRSDLMVMSKFSYWKTQETNVFANGCPEEYRMTIRGILEKGVTVWNDPDDIGRIDPATNVPLEGITY